MSTSLLSAVWVCPWLVLWVVAGVLAGARWNRHPTVSALVVTASALHVLGSLAQAVMPMAMMERGVEPMAMGLVSGFASLISLVGSGCLVAAVFAGRQDPRPG